MGAARIIQGALMAVVIAVLVGGALLLGGASSSGLATDAEALIVSFYESGDPQLVLDHVIAGSIPDDPGTTASVLEQIGAVITVPAEVVETRVVSPLAGQLAIVEMSDGLPWCVDEDQGVLLGCRLGQITLEATVDGAPVRVDLASMSVYADEAQLLVALVTAEQDGAPYRLEGEPRVVPASGGASPFELEATVYFAEDGSSAPTDERPLRIRADQALVLDFRAHDFDDALPLASDAQIVWEGASIAVTVTDATWYVE